MFEKIINEIVDGKKTYSVSGFALISNVFSKVHIPETIPEWTELFNLWAAIGAFVLVLWRLFSKLRNKKNENK